LNETLDTKGQGDAQTVSIAGGSLLVIGLMLWFFTSGTKNELQSLRKEMQEVKESLEKQTNALKQLQLTTRNDALDTRDGDNAKK
jgi:hypothetical protein